MLQNNNVTYPLWCFDTCNFKFKRGLTLKTNYKLIWHATPPPKYPYEPPMFINQLKFIHLFNANLAQSKTHMCTHTKLTSSSLYSTIANAYFVYLGIHLPIGREILLALRLDHLQDLNYILGQVKVKFLIMILVYC